MGNELLINLKNQWKFYHCHHKIIVVSHIQVCKYLHNLQLFASVASPSSPFLKMFFHKLFGRCFSQSPIPLSPPFLCGFPQDLSLVSWSLYLCFISEKNHPQTLIKFYNNDSASPSRCEFSYQNKTGSD